MKTQSNPIKQLVMLDGGGSCATLKLGNAAGLHYYDGQMLWVNPATTVTAAAPRQPVAGTGVNTIIATERGKKTIPICDPQTGEELQIETKKEKKTSPVPSPPLVPVNQQQVTPLLQIAQPLFQGPFNLQNPQQAIQTNYLTTSPLAATRAVPQSPPQSTVLELLSKATLRSPRALLQSDIVQTGATQLPLSLFQQQPATEEDDFHRRRGRGQNGGRGTQGRGRGSQQNNRDQAPQKARRNKQEQAVLIPGDRYVGQKYTASIDGRFWCLSEWPSGERDEQHSLNFGKHKLPVEENGVIRVILYGGVNRYKVKIHLATEGDELGANDPEGFFVCTCSPNASDVELTKEAKDLGWKIYAPSESELPCLYPPGVDPPMVSNEEETNKEETKKE